jgi:hypothetical protein
VVARAAAASSPCAIIRVIGTFVIRVTKIVRIILVQLQRLKLCANNESLSNNSSIKKCCSIGFQVPPVWLLANWKSRHFHFGEKEYLFNFNFGRNQNLH